MFVSDVQENRRSLQKYIGRETYKGGNGRLGGCECGLDSW